MRRRKPNVNKEYHRHNKIFKDAGIVFVEPYRGTRKKFLEDLLARLKKNAEDCIEVHWEEKLEGEESHYGQGVIDATISLYCSLRSQLEEAEFTTEKDA